MDHLTKAQLTTLRAKLDAERELLFSRLGDETSDLAATPDAEPHDIEDGAAEDAGHFRAHSLRQHDRARLAEIEAALARMDNGSYGICEDSDDEIPYRRLELEPTTRFTVEALEQRESEAGVADPHDDEPIGY